MQKNYVLGIPQNRIKYGKTDNYIQDEIWLTVATSQTIHDLKHGILDFESKKKKPLNLIAVADFDGLLITGPVNSYHPNDFGLYNMAGNVSEWVLEHDRLKGGSWNSWSYFLQITSREEKSTISNCEVGFRLLLVQ